MRVLNACRHTVPLALRPILRDLLFSLHPATIIQPSGVRLRISGDTDWIHYTEIFRKREYDVAIDRAIALADAAEPLMIVDLGANYGFFTLRAIDKVRAQDRRDVRVVAFEASARGVGEFRARVIDDNALAAWVKPVHGLVGNRGGTAQFYEGRSHGDSSVFRRGTASQVGAPLPFVNVSAHLDDAPIIHLLKCDIEGAELQFIRNFPDVLRKTRVSVFELHDDLCDTDECLRLLGESGFAHQEQIRRAGSYSLHCLWR